MDFKVRIGIDVIFRDVLAAVAIGRVGSHDLCSKFSLQHYKRQIIIIIIFFSLLLLLLLLFF